MSINSEEKKGHTIKLTDKEWSEVGDAAENLGLPRKRGRNFAIVKAVREMNKKHDRKKERKN
jgi:hypothetical protein